MNFAEAADRVLKKLNAMTPEELKAEMDKYKESDLTKILIDCGFAQQELDRINEAKRIEGK